MVESNKKSMSNTSKNKVNRSDVEAIAESVLEKQHDYLESRFDQLQQMGKDTEGKLGAIQTHLTTLSESIGTINAEMGKIRSDVKGHSKLLATQDAMLQQMQLKLADMEDRSRRCNIRITGLAEGLEGSSAVQYLTQSLPKWFPSLGSLQGEIMRAHRVYTDNKNRGNARTMIFCVLRFTTCQAILRAARKNPLTVEGRRVRFLPDYSSYTLKRHLAFSQAMDNARAKGVVFFLLYPAILKIKVGGGRVESFQSPKDAEDFIHSLPAMLPLSNADDGTPVEIEGTNADAVA